LSRTKIAEGSGSKCIKAEASWWTRKVEIDGAIEGEIDSKSSSCKCDGN